MPRTLFFLPVMIVGLASCSDPGHPTDPTVDGGPSFQISDAVHSSGNPHFFFLPPMVPNPEAEFSEPFDGTLQVLVEICVWSTVYGECGPQLEFYDMTSGPGSETVRVVGESYVVNWNTDGILDREELSLGEGEVYRIRVRVGGRELGHADVEVVGSGRELKNVDTDESIPLLDGRTLPIRFRIEEGALAYGVQVMAGGLHSCGLATDGNTYCWGSGVYGQLGNGTTTPVQYTPVAVESPVQFVSVTAGAYHTCGLTSDGAAYCWGYNLHGQIGNGTTALAQTTAVEVNFGGKFMSLALGDYHTCGLTPDGSAYCWGYGRWGEIGNGTITLEQTTPVAVSFGGKFSSLTAGSYHTCGITTMGPSHCWGFGRYGQLGDGSTTETQTTPVEVVFAGQLRSISAGGFHVCGLTLEGTAYCWGKGDNGQRGDGSTTETQATPVEVTFLGQFAVLAGGGFHTCALTPDGTAYCWGLGENGQRGDGSTAPVRSTPVAVDFTGEFSSLSLGYYHTCGTSPNQTAYCWGLNTSGQLGDGGIGPNQQTTPNAVLGFPPG